MTVFRDSTAIVATSAQLGAVALAHRSYVNRNPRAIVRDRVLMHDGCMQARMISEPLCLCDNCQESDDAIARVLTRADRARDLRRQSAYIHASSPGHDAPTPRGKSVRGLSARHESGDRSGTPIARHRMHANQRRPNLTGQHLRQHTERRVAAGSLIDGTGTRQSRALVHARISTFDKRV